MFPHLLLEKYHKVCSMSIGGFLYEIFNKIRKNIEVWMPEKYEDAGRY